MRRLWFFNGSAQAADICTMIRRSILEQCISNLEQCIKYFRVHSILEQWTRWLGVHSEFKAAVFQRVHLRFRAEAYSRHVAFSEVVLLVRQIFGIRRERKLRKIYLFIILRLLRLTLQLRTHVFYCL